MTKAINWLWRERWGALAWVVGAFLRLYLLRSQIVTEDEWHSIHAVRSLGYGEIFGHFGLADVCIPLTLFDKAVSSSVGLSEWIMRAPVLACALASLVVFPLLVARAHGRAVGTALAWLLAVSPIHIYYSRLARPYAIALLLQFAGALAFYFWWSTRRRSWCALYAVCAIVGPYFHLSVAAVLWTPLGYAVGRRALDRSAPSPFKLLAVVASGSALWLAAPLWRDAQSLTGKVARGHLTLSSVRLAAQMMVGSGNAVVKAAAFVLAAAGVFLLIRRRESRGLALFLAALLAVHELTIVVMRPDGIEGPIVFLRYSLFALPLLLWAVALSLTAVGERLRRYWAPAGGAPLVLACAATLYWGPAAVVYRFPNNWTSHGPDQGPSWTEPSSYYRQLTALPPGSLRVVEAPWYAFSGADPYYYYQRLHRQQMLIGFTDVDGQRPGELSPHDARFRLRNSVHVLDEEGLCERSVDRVIFHHDLDAEKFPDLSPRPPLDVAPLIERYRRRYGPPLFEDAQISVFDPSPCCGAGRAACDDAEMTWSPL